MSATRRALRNPYVGPQSFRRGDALYGRDQEVGDLLDLLIAERVVLLHSPSGAGKTSLIQARLLLLLEQEGFEVLPVIRLTHEVPAAVSQRDPPVNRYVLSALLSLEEGLPADLQRPLPQLADMSLAQYLAEWPDLDDRPGNEVLVFDQFEEVITADPVDHEAKSAFFADLGATLRDRSLWALFSMREDFVAELDPYARFVPTRFATRFRLDLLTVDQALQAVTQPARDAGVAFEDEAAIKLVDDLRRVRTQRGSSMVEELGRHVEPVQLQVSCRQLWQGLGDADRIGIDDIESIGDVNEALADYYAACVATVAQETGVSQRALRDWFERELVTSQGFRGQVLDGPESAGEAGPRVLELLTDAHLLRAESRRGAVWYELAHDRLTQPIEEDNARWRDQHLSIVERRASEWDAEARPDRLLLSGPDLEQGRRWLARPGVAPTSVERDYLAASMKSQQQRDDLVHAAVRTRRWLRVSIGLLVLAVVTATLAIWGAFRAFDESRQAEQAADEAERSALLSDAISEISSDNQLSILLTLRALGTSKEPGKSPSSWEAGNALQRALSSSPVTQRLGDTDSADVAVAWSEDAAKAVIADEDGNVRLVDTGSGRTLSEHADVGEVRAVAISPTDTGLVAIGRANGSVLLWRSSGDAEPEEVTSHEGAVNDVAFSPDGRLASAGADGQVHVVDGDTQVAERQLAPEVNAVAWSTDRELVHAVDSSGGLTAWNPDSNGQVTNDPGRHDGEATAVDVSKDGTRIATRGADDRIVITRLDGRGKRVEADLFSSGRGPSISFTTDGRRLLALDSIGGVDVVNATTGATVGNLSSVGQAPIAVEASPRDPAEALVTTRDAGAAVWSTELGHEDHILVAVESDRTGHVVTGAYQDDTILMWSPDGQRVVGRKEISGADILAAALDPQGRFLVHTSAADGEARITPLSGYGPAIRLTDGVSAVDVSASGARVATGGEDSEVRVWDARTGQRVAVLSDHTGPIRALDFGREENELLTVSDDGTAIVWDVDQKRALRTIRAEDDPITTAEWSETGDRIALGRESGTVQLFEPGPQTDLKQLDWHTDSVADLAFDAEGERLVSVGDDGFAVIWNARNGDRMRTLKHSSWLYRVAFTEDGDHLLLSSNTGEPMTVWLDPDELTKIGESRATRDLTATECHRYVPGNDGCAGP